MASIKVKVAVALGISFLLGADRGSVLVAQTNSPDNKLDSLTLQVVPEVFSKNLTRHADETLNTASTHPLEILQDVLRINGFIAGTNATMFDKSRNEITTRNTPKALEIFRRTVADLNRENVGSTNPPQDPSVPARQVVLIEAEVYQLNDAAWETLQLGKPTHPAKRGDARFGTFPESPVWTISQEKKQTIRTLLKASSAELLSRPRIQTSYGTGAKVFIGNEITDVTLACLPLPPAGDTPSELKVQGSTTGKFNRNPSGDWPTVAGRTNCAFYAKVAIADGDVLIFDAQHPEGKPLNHLLVLMEMKEVR